MMFVFPRNSAMKILKLKSLKEEQQLEVWLEAGDDVFSEVYEKK